MIPSSALTSDDVEGTARHLASLGQRIGDLYAAAQRSEFVFGSPLGTFRELAVEYHVPRFVYFGPNTSQESVRLAIMGGIGRFDRLAAEALLSFVEGLVREPRLGQSINLSIFPVVNVLGLIGGYEERDLSDVEWLNPKAAEIELLKQEVLQASFHGLIRVTTSTEETLSACVRTVLPNTIQIPPQQVLSSELFGPWNFRFELTSPSEPAAGCLAFAALLPIAPFEIELAVPADWPQPVADLVIAQMLQRLIIHFRPFSAFG